MKYAYPWRFRAKLTNLLGMREVTRVLANHGSFRELYGLCSRILVGPFFEEITRSAWIVGLAAYCSRKTTWVAASILWAIAHTVALPSSIFVIFQAFALSRSRCLIASFLAHVLWNGSILLNTQTGWLLKLLTVMGGEAMSAVGIALALLAWALLLKMPSNATP